MKSRTLINKQAKRKKNSEIVETIFECKKNKNPEWLKIASILSGPRRKRVEVNLDKINRETKEGDTIVIPGKVLGLGDIDKKIRIVALFFSESAKEKLKNKKSEIISILDEIKSNPKAQGIKILK